MTGLRLMPRLECENDAGGQFTNDPGRDSQRHGSRFLCGCCGCTWFCPVGGDALGSPTGTGATPHAGGLVRVRTQVCFHTPAPVPWGRSRSINPYAGRRFERRFEAADHPFADRPAVWQPGITEQGRGTPDGSGHSPSRQVRDAPVPGDRWPSRTGSLRSRPQAPERHRRSGGRGATAKQPVTYGTAFLIVTLLAPYPSQRRLCRVEWSGP